MILLPCPWCGPRSVNEFAHVGEVRSRPDPNAATPSAWRAYLYDHVNPAGWVRENWYHRFGCRQYFSVQRDTVSNRVRPVGDGEPEPLTGPDARSAQPSAGSEPGAGGSPA